MGFRSLLIGIAVMFAACTAYGQPVTMNEGKAFFEKYVNLGSAFDPNISTLYTAESRIKTLRRYPNGSERVVELDGNRWKTLIEAAMPMAKAKGDRSQFTNVQLEATGNVLKIKADRYSNLKCYTDRGYYMVVGRQSAGDLYVVEEYSETQPQTDC